MSDEQLDPDVEAGLARLQEGYVPPVRPSTNGHARRDVDAPVVFGPECRWPDDVWGVITPGPLGDHLRKIKRAARSRQRCATAVGGVVLARIAAGIPHTVRLDNTVGSDQPCCIFGFIVGGPGTGKGDAVSIGSELLRPGSLPLLVDGVNDHLPPGSGQGLIDVMFDMVEEHDANGKPRKVKRQVRNNAFFQLDEGEAMTSLAGQSSSIVLETIRTIWSGHTVGQYNVEIERRRVLPGGTYTYGLIGGIQPTKAGTILEDDEGGTPQRFMWFPSIDPDIPDEREHWPGGLDWDMPTALDLDKVSVVGPGGYVCHYLTQTPEIQAEIRAYDLAVQRGATTLNLLDAHAMNMRRRVAAVLTILDGRLHIDALCWELAKIIMACSDATRAVVIDANVRSMARAAKVRNVAAGHTEIAKVEAVEARRTVDASRKIGAKVHEVGADGITRGELYKGPCRRHRDVFDDALAAALAEEWIVEQSEPGQGESKRLYTPGPKRP